MVVTDVKSGNEVKLISTSTNNGNTTVVVAQQRPSNEEDEDSDTDREIKSLDLTCEYCFSLSFFNYVFVLFYILL